MIVIGAGGAGMMCALTAGSRGRSVVLLDHNHRVGRKILISGGGRCNFTNLYAGPENYLSQNPHFCKSALARYTPYDFIALVKKHRIAFHEKKLGQLFCDRSARQIVDMLVAECEDAGAHFVLECKIENIKKDDERFIVSANGSIYESQSLIIATGGLSVPQTGATGFGYKIAEQFGLKMIAPEPALDGFNLTGEQMRQFNELAGISLDTVVTCNGGSFRENILFTHNGLSGPASLQASLYWRPGDRLSIDLLPEFDLSVWLATRQQEGCKLKLKNLLSEFWPRRFAEIFSGMFLPAAPLQSLSPKQLQEINACIHDWHFKPAGTVGFRKAEVTRGGVDTAELSSQTMECRKVPGLYFIGEVVDVTGWLGGYNFQWAWASGYAAGQHV